MADNDDVLTEFDEELFTGLIESITVLLVV